MKMDIATSGLPQKKVFRARKTMKISDRQQLEFLHNTLPTSTITSPSAPPTLVNGNHTEKEGTYPAKEAASQRDSSQNKEFPVLAVSRYPSPLALSLSLSPSPPSKSPETGTCASVLTALQSPICGDKDERNLKTSDEDDGKKMDIKKEDAKPKIQQALTNGLKPKNDCSVNSEGLQQEEVMDLEPVSIATDSLETPGPSLNTTLSSPSSPSNAPESDQEVKEGFLVLSEEDDNQTEKDDDKETDIDRDSSEAKMEAGSLEFDKSLETIDQLSNRVDSGPAGTENGVTTQGGKRSLDKALLKGALEEEGERSEKRQRVDGEAFEAQFELKISADPGRRLKLEKVVHKLVEEQLRVLQLTVFDRSLQELKERVEKLECATKQQQTLNNLQAKIARLAKKFGAANQTKENSKAPVSVQPVTINTFSSTTTRGSSPTSRSVKTAIDCEQTNESQTLNPVSSTASPQTKLISAPNSTATGPTLLSLPVTTSSVPLNPGVTTVTSQNQQGALLLNTKPGSTALTPSTSASATQPVSLLIQLPLSVTGKQGAGMELLPVSSLGPTTTLNKAKMTAPTTALIYQKSTTAITTAPLQALPQITMPRVMCQGGGVTVSVPSPAMSVSSAQTPAQCASVTGVTSAATSPASTAPAATGGQSTGSAAAVPTLVPAMASKTDASTTVRAPVQTLSTKSSKAVIDLTEDDDDVLVTGVSKAPVAASIPVAASPASVSQRPPAVISASGTTSRSSPQSNQPAVNGPQVSTLSRISQDSPSKNRFTSASSNLESSQLPPLPAPAPPSRLPPEAAQTSPPQQPQLKLARVQSQNGIVLSWSVAETDRTCAAVESYHLYAYHQDQTMLQSQWKKIGEVKALPLPMACTLTQFVSGSTYYFAVCARDVFGRFGVFCEPQCTDVITPTSST